jgi:hypothetical protein
MQHSRSYTFSSLYPIFRTTTDKGVWDLWIFTSANTVTLCYLSVIVLNMGHTCYLFIKQINDQQQSLCQNINHYVNQCQATNGHKATTNVHF